VNITKIALVTGANKGIGYQTARLLGVDHHMMVYVGARDPGRGEQAAASLRAAEWTRSRCSSTSPTKRP